MPLYSRTRSLLLLSALCCLGVSAYAASDTTLPNGSEFHFWEKPLTFSKTYYVSASNGDDANPGTQERPFRTISKAAQVLLPGERVVIAEGLYRESVDPARGGTGPDKVISYEAAPNAHVIVSGAAIVTAWEPSTGFTYRGPHKGDPQIFQTKLDGNLFGGYNPFGLLNVPQQKAYLVSVGNHPPGQPGYNMPWLRTSLNLATYYRHRGLVFVDGKPLTQVDNFADLADPAGPPRPGSRAVNATIVEEPQNNLYDEIGGAAGRVWIENNGMALHIRLNNDANPEGHKIEITTKETVFSPSQRGLGYIRVKGIEFQYAGNGFPMPQRGLVSTNRGHHWIFEDNTFEWANSIGLDIGDEVWDATMPPETLGFDVVRHNTFRYCGIEGLGGAGNPGGLHGVLVEDNLFEWIGWQDAAGMSESAAMKLHNAVDLLFRRNVIRHIRHANGVWLDTVNENTRLTGNIFADIPGEINPHAIHIEATALPNEIDNNIFSGLTAGVLIRDTNNLIVANNLFLDCRAGISMTTGLAAPRLIGSYGHTADGWNNQIYNNVFHSIGLEAIQFTTTTNHSDGNVFSKMPYFGGYLRVTGPTTYQVDDVPEQWLDLAMWQEEHDWDKHGKVVDIKASFDPDTLELTLTYPTDLVKLPVFDHLDTDFFGHTTGKERFPGPFAEEITEKRNVDPRR